MKKNTQFIAFLGMFILPFTAFAENKKLLECGGPNQPSCGICDLFTLINTAVDVILKGLIPLIAVLIIAWAGFRMMINQGNTDVAKQSKEIMLAVAIGLVVMFSSYAVVGLILDSMGYAQMNSPLDWAPDCKVDTIE
ncbi:MAG: hypothetical protein WA093_02970 [Minisyncoccales bacterium]